MRLLVDPRHTVLAGGRVCVEVLRRGSQSVLAGLDARFQGACQPAPGLQGTTVEQRSP